MAAGHVSMKYGFKVMHIIYLWKLLDFLSTCLDYVLLEIATSFRKLKLCIQGPNHAAVTACATGAHSIGDATRMIQFGDADVMIAGGTESSVDALSIAGFCR